MARDQARTTSAYRSSAVNRKETERTHSTVRTGMKRRLQLWMLFMCVFLIWSGYTYVSQMFDLQELEQKKLAKTAELQSTQQRRDELNEEINKLNTTEYVLQIARSRGMRLPDELLIRTQE